MCNEIKLIKVIGRTFNFIYINKILITTIIKIIFSKKNRIVLNLKKLILIIYS